MRTRRLATVAAVVTATMTTLAPMASADSAGVTSRASLSSQARQGNDGAVVGAISADGRFVTFTSGASNLVDGDSNGMPDVFVRDRLAGTTQRVSVSTAGLQGNGESYRSTISPDGRFVAFVSAASNLVAGDTNGYEDVFVRDRLTGTTQRVSVSTAGAQADDVSDRPAISADGRYVAFTSAATNLVAHDTNALPDVFVRDRLARTTRRVSVSSTGAQADNESGAFNTAISANGRWVAFESSASNLVRGDTNDTWDVFVRDRRARTTRRVSVSTAGAQADSLSERPAMSPDGRFVVFESDATNLVRGDSNGTWDVFIRDRRARRTHRVSISTAGRQANGIADWAAVSANGRFVAFESSASNLVSGDTNGNWDVFVRDRHARTTSRVSTSSTGAQGNNDSLSPVISAHGRHVAFNSLASNLVPGDTNGWIDVFVRDPMFGAAG